jgi:hypothetical protein
MQQNQNRTSRSGHADSEHMDAHVSNFDAQTQSLAAASPDSSALVGSAASPPIRQVRPERVEWLKRYNESLRIPGGW